MANAYHRASIRLFFTAFGRFHESYVVKRFSRRGDALAYGRGRDYGGWFIY